MFVFDLVDEPWIPVVTPDGRVLVSLRECLVHAHRFLGFAVDAPLETVAVFRQVVLPVYLDAVFCLPGCPMPRSNQQWAELWQRRNLDVRPSWAPKLAAPDPPGEGPISAYLTRHREWFQVFGDRPFAQVAGLRTGNDESKPVSLLIAAAASGNNVPLFSARTEGDPPALTPPEAVRAVLATHCWDTAGIKSGAVGDPHVKAGKTTGNLTGPLGAIGVVLPIGTTLAETLLLHVPVTSQRAGQDRPQWRATPTSGHPAGWAAREPLGLLDLLTWQSRRIRLIPEPGPDGTVVRRVVLAAGDRMTMPPEIEPHTAWRMSKVKKIQTPVRHVVGQAAWQGMLPMLATAPNNPDGTSTPVLRLIQELQAEHRLAPDYALRVLTVGLQYGTQSAVVEDLIVDMTPLPVAALAVDGDVYRLLEAMVQQAEDLRRAANRLGDDIRLAAGGGKLPWDKGQRFGDRMIHEFTPTVRRILSLLQQHPDGVDEAENHWRVNARRTALGAAEPVLNGAPPEAFLGRVVSARETHRTSVAEARYRGAVRNILGTPERTTTHSGGA